MRELLLQGRLCGSRVVFLRYDDTATFLPVSFVRGNNTAVFECTCCHILSTLYMVHKNNPT